MPFFHPVAQPELQAMSFPPLMVRTLAAAAPMPCGTIAPGAVLAVMLLRCVALEVEHGGAMNGINPTKDSDPQDHSPIVLRELPIVDSPHVDGIKLVAVRDKLMLIYSIQKSDPPLHYEMAVFAASVEEPAAMEPVATVKRLLPAPPMWDARYDEATQSLELIYEQAGGALSSLIFQDGAGRATCITSNHPFESFFRPHFLRGAERTTPDIGAVVDNRSVVVFPHSAKLEPTEYVSLTPHGDGLVGQSDERWVVAKSVLSGSALFDVLPGRLSLMHFPTDQRQQEPRSTAFPDVVAFEFDAANVDSDVVVFATGKPSVLLLGSRPGRPKHLTASDRRWLGRLSRPTIHVASEFVHLAAIANRESPHAVVLYAEIPIRQLLSP